MDIQKMRIGLCVIAILNIGIILAFFFDYSDPSWATNRGNYIGMIAMACVALSVLFSYFHVRRRTDHSA